VDVAHMQGYPLWTALNRLWIYGGRRMLALQGSEAYLANLLNAILSAAAATVICACVRSFLVEIYSPTRLQAPSTSSDGQQTSTAKRPRRTQDSGHPRAPSAKPDEGLTQSNVLMDHALWAGVFAAGT
jgi:hypothetical protein